MLRVCLLCLWLGFAAFPAAAAAPFRVYISNERAGQVTVIDGESHAVLATWEVGKRPRGLHLSLDGKRLYVAVSGSPRVAPGADPSRAAKPDKAADGIAIVDTSNGQVLRKLYVGSDPEEFALSADGRRLFVSNEDEARASAWDIETGQQIFSAVVSEEPEGVALHPGGRHLYVTCEERGEVFILDPEDGRSLSKVGLGGRPRTITFSKDATSAFVPVEGKAEVAVIDGRRLRLSHRIPISTPGAMPMDSVLASDGRELWVSTGRGNGVAVIDVDRGDVVDHVALGQRVWGMGLSPDGRLLFTANGASNDVSVVDVRTRREVKRIPVSDGPWGVCIR